MSDARSFVGKVIKRLLRANPHSREDQIASSVWQAVSAAVVSRAAGQLASTADADNPLGFSLSLLDHPSQSLLITVLYFTTVLYLTTVL